MSDWSRGYVADFEYPGLFHAEQAPSFLNLVCLLNGQAPVATTPGFRYCELGCGPGVTLCLLAAANPQGEFHGIDFMPSHVERGRELAASAGLGNVFFHEAAFEDFEGGDRALAPFDFIAVYGVYTWVSPATRAAIRSFLLRHLRTGGLAFFGSNVLPGWERAVTVQHLLVEIGGLVNEEPLPRFARAVDILERLRKAGARGLHDHPTLREITARLDDGSGAYVVHEYGTRHWQPMLFAELARDLAAAKLSHVGSAMILETDPELALSAEQRAFLAEIGPPELAESVKDVFQRRRFRRDVFRRGGIRLDAQRQAALLEAMTVAAVRPPSDINLKLSRPAGAAEERSEAFGPIYAALAEGPMRLGDLLDLARRRGHPVEAAEAAVRLVGSGQVQPVVASSGDSAAASVLRFNRATIERALRAPALATHEGVASAMLGSGIGLDRIAQYAYARLTAANSPVADAAMLTEDIWQAMQARGERLVVGGRPATEGEAEPRRHLLERVTRILDEELRLWRRLGAA